MGKGAGCEPRKVLLVFKPDSWSFLLMENMPEMVGLSPSLGDSVSQQSPVFRRTTLSQLLHFFSCYLFMRE